MELEIRIKLRRKALFISFPEGPHNVYYIGVYTSGKSSLGDRQRQKMIREKVMFFFSFRKIIKNKRFEKRHLDSQSLGDETVIKIRNRFVCLFSRGMRS